MEIIKNWLKDYRLNYAGQDIKLFIDERGVPKFPDLRPTEGTRE